MSNRLIQTQFEEPKPRFYQSIIKVCPTDPPGVQADDIADGIGYAAVLLLDEHGWSADRIAEVLARVRDEIYEEANSRAD